MPAERERYDVVIVGGGPAGLSAALLLGRCRLKTLVCDSGRYRNQRATAMHGYLTRDGVEPHEFLEQARRDALCYPSVSYWRGEVTDTLREGPGFVVQRQRAPEALCRKLVLASGVIDELPPLEGAPELLGRGLHHCPYCDGFELAEQPLAVYGKDGQRAANLARLLTRWSSDIVLCTHGRAVLEAAERARLDRLGIAVDERPIARLEQEQGRLRWIVFEGGESLERRALFFNTGRHQATDFALRLGCAEFAVKGCELDSRSGKTSVPGLYVIGDASRDVLQVVVAAGEGCAAAIEINCELFREDGVLD